MSKPSSTNYPLAFFYDKLLINCCIFFLYMSLWDMYWHHDVTSVRRSYGDYSSGVHLFPFRTESLSPLAQMVLQFLWESMSLPIFFNPSHPAGFFFYIPLPCRFNFYLPLASNSYRLNAFQSPQFYPCYHPVVDGNMHEYTCPGNRYNQLKK